MSVDTAIVKNSELESARMARQSACSIAIVSTFTAEPVEGSLALLLEELGQSALIEFAPYSQVFQQLLDPASLLSANRYGVNVVLVRVLDWQRFHGASLDVNARQHPSHRTRRT